MEKYSKQMADAIEDCVNAWSQVQEESIKKGLARLAAYEDTGLEPEEINRVLDAYRRGHTLRTESAERLEIIRDIPTVHLQELVQAEKGHKVYKIDGFYCNICQKWHKRVVCIDDCYLTNEKAEAALKGGGK